MTTGFHFISCARLLEPNRFGWGAGSTVLCHWWVAVKTSCSRSYIWTWSDVWNALWQSLVGNPVSTAKTSTVIEIAYEGPEAWEHFKLPELSHTRNSKTFQAYGPACIFFSPCKLGLPKGKQTALIFIIGVELCSFCRGFQPFLLGNPGISRGGQVRNIACGFFQQLSWKKVAF